MKVLCCCSLSMSWVWTFADFFKCGLVRSYDITHGHWRVFRALSGQTTSMRPVAITLEQQGTISHVTRCNPSQNIPLVKI